MCRIYVFFYKRSIHNEETVPVQIKVLDTEPVLQVQGRAYE